MSRAIPFAEMLEAFEFASLGQPGESAAYLCKDAGTFHFHSEYGDEEPLPDDTESERYIAIPHKNDLDLGKRLVLRFAAEVMPDDERKIHEIFSRPGAYARFRDLLENRGTLKQWYAFEEKAKGEALRAWCAEHAVEIDG